MVRPLQMQGLFYIFPFMKTFLTLLIITIAVIATYFYLKAHDGDDDVKHARKQIEMQNRPYIRE